MGDSVGGSWLDSTVSPTCDKTPPPRGGAVRPLASARKVLFQAILSFGVASVTGLSAHAAGTRLRACVRRHKKRIDVHV